MTNPLPPLLFLSHATEDKGQIARPLKDALSARYRVWWDEDVIKAGDSLFAQINAGLAACDFGVIVISPAYLQKNWTQAELAGFFGLARSRLGSGCGSCRYAASSASCFGSSTARAFGSTAGRLSRL